MLAPTKGIYPSWIDDKDIIEQLLNEIIVHGGKLPVNFVINNDSDKATEARMKGIIETMKMERLIISPLQETDSLEIDIEGSRAVHIGYRKYKKIKKWDSTFDFLSKFSLVLFFLAVIVGIGFLIYFALHYFKVL